MLSIQVVKSDGPPQDHFFTKPEVMIGRRPDNDLVLTGRDVSGSHACLQIEGDRPTLFDLRSTNGTYVNGQRISTQVEVGPDDVIKISEFTLLVRLANERPKPSATGQPHHHEPVSMPELEREPEPPEEPPVSEDGPPLARDPLVSTAPAVDFGDDMPPVVARARIPAGTPLPSTSPPIARRVTPREPTPPPVAPLGPPSNSPPGDVVAPSTLAQAWQDPTVRRLFVVGLGRLEVERDGVRLPLAQTFASVDDLSIQLGAVCGQPIRCAVSERILTDGTVIQATESSEFGPYIVITRPRHRRLVGLDALVQERLLPGPAAELLSACARARMPVLLAALPGASAGTMLTALLGAQPGPSALVRGLPTPVPTPRGCHAFDAAYGEGRMAAVVRLARAGDIQSLGIDEPEAAALEESAWAVADGCGLVVGLRADSLPGALRRARSAGTEPDGPAISYAVVALLARTSQGHTGLHWLGELSPGDGPNNVHELFTTDRRGALIATAVPRLIASLGERNIHLSEALFTPT